MEDVSEASFTIEDTDDLNKCPALIENRFEEIIVTDFKVGIILEMFIILIWTIIGLEELVSELSWGRRGCPRIFCESLTVRTAMEIIVEIVILIC